MIAACQICFGTTDSALRASLNSGIFVLLGVTAVVLICFALFIARLAKRARQSRTLERAA